MPTETHEFHLRSTWTGGSEGAGTAALQGGAAEFGVPAELGGAPGRTSPEELLLAAVASCYSITFGILAERRKLAFAGLDTELTGTVERQLGGTLKYVAIRIVARIALETDDDAQKQTALDLAHKAEQYCLISNAVRGSVQLTVAPEIVVVPPA